MEYTVSKPLRHFEFWGDAKNFANQLSGKELDDLEYCLSRLREPEDGVWTDDDINDYFTHDKDWLCLQLGYEDYEDFDMQHDPDYVDDDELEKYAEEWLTRYITIHRNDEETLTKVLKAMALTEAYEEYENDFSEKRPGLYMYLMMQIKYNDFDIMLYLFDEDEGNVKFSEIPTKKGLRKLAMRQKKEGEYF